MNSTKERYTCRLRDITVTIIPRSWGRHTRSSEYYAEPRMYVDVADEETLLDNLMNRKRRPYNVYKTLIHGSLLNQVFNLGKLRWSQRAGCSCPCSPGFILPKQTLNIGGHTFSEFDVWVKIENAPSVDETKAPRQLTLAV